MAQKYEHYYVPSQSHWPIVGSIGLGAIALGIANLLHEKGIGHYLFFVGSLLIVWMMYGWFRDVIKESHKGLYSAQMDRSFRWGMAWFIFSEVMFFGAFFGALFYARLFSVPWLGGAIGGESTHQLLWENFQATWPLLKTPSPEGFTQPLKAMEAWGLPALNTLILLTSGVTITWSHWGLLKNKRNQLILGLFMTIALGCIFLGLQALEYHEAYHEYHLRLDSGIYGTTFFMLTGFHGAHVTLGTIMLITIFLRSVRGHFKPESHFAFEAVAWYWHFVDVVWVILFIFVYWL
ncbi:MAG TPA: cytochrome c oxidase subunit 3 [Gammaproteobacteria bacterium]|nr:cytochrome c oxidase subunit 3 [Gammaproteobacteria bacterium]